MSHESHDVDELGWSGLGHMTEPDHHKYKDPNVQLGYSDTCADLKLGMSLHKLSV